VAAGLTDSRARTAANLVDSVVATGLLPAERADEVEAAVRAAPTTLTYGGATSADRGAQATLAATLRSDAPVAGAELAFTLGPRTCTATTDASGMATCAVVVEAPPGEATVEVAFAGTADLRASAASAPFTVRAGSGGTLAYTGPAAIPVLRSTRLSAVLVDGGSAPLPGKRLTFTVGSGRSAQHCSGRTDANGRASCTLRVVQPLGPRPLEVAFAGDASAPAAVERREVVLFAYPARGTFVVGDVSAASGGTVTCWGRDWAARTELSGSQPPAGFLGFSASTPSCGGTWSARRGHGESPPSIVAAYLGVAVTSAAHAGQAGAGATHSGGGTFSGDVVGIVVVRTDRGYTPDPDTPGAGTVVAVVCGAEAGTVPR